MHRQHKIADAIIKRGNKEELLGLFAFENDTAEALVIRFNIWSRHFYPQFFQSTDASFHGQIDINNARVYLGEIPSFTNLGFRGCAKTTRTKLFCAYVIANDVLKRRKYLKVLSRDVQNSKQVVTDIYNLLVDPPIRQLYPEIFYKTDTKREETMASFTTATGIKLTADTVGSDQRGQIQDESRPDFIWFDDFETRASLKSAVITKTIWDNMEEARTGLSVDGGVIYTGNYLSERGNIHKLVSKESPSTPVLNVPIIEDGKPTWKARYPMSVVNQIQHDAEDFEGEYLGKPSASKDIIYDREILDKMEKRMPIKEVAGQRIFREYNASHRYGLGADVAGGVGLDSSTSVIIDFDTLPAQVVATYANNIVKPDIFGDELARHGQRFGECLLAPEQNNHGHATIGRLKQIYPLENLYQAERPDSKVQNRMNPTAREYGWETNALTKPKMIFGLAKAIEDGLLVLNDERLIAETRAYTRNDLMDAEIDPRLTTRHFDLLTALCIAWQLKDSPLLQRKQQGEVYHQAPYQPTEYEGAREAETIHTITEAGRIHMKSAYKQAPYQPDEYEGA